MQTIGFIGVGTMGKPMVRNLMKAGFNLRIFARNKDKVKDVIAQGAAFCDSIAECVKGCEAVITIVGYPTDVEEVYFEKGGILGSAEKGAYLIDMTTSSPSLARRISEMGASRGFHVLDAPVTGGVAGAEGATLSILVGGSTEDFEVCKPLFFAMGTNVNRQGAAGYGQHAKLANQIIIAGTLSGVCEALAYGKAQGLDLHTLLASVSTGAAGSTQLSTFGPMILADDFSPSFFLKHLVKDLTLACEEAEEANLPLEILDQALRNYRELEDRGLGNLGTQALIKHYDHTA